MEPQTGEEAGKGSVAAALYLVTGGAGFIGSHLTTALLDAGHRVRILDNMTNPSARQPDARCELIVGDVAGEQQIRAAMSGASGCFHLAAVSSVAQYDGNWAECHRVNFTGSVAVIDAARAAGNVPVVYASSAAVYGEQNEGPLRESACPRPISGYGVDKLGAERHARLSSKRYGLPTLGLRFFNIYGPGRRTDSPDSGVIAIFSQRLADRLPVKIQGSGNQRRDFVHVDDAVAFLRAGMAWLTRTRADAVLNVCTGRAISILELARTLGALARLEPSFEFEPARAGDIDSSFGDPSAANATLGLSATISLEEGLSRTISRRTKA
jgi:UDP-glucose 4-epimerase